MSDKVLHSRVRLFGVATLTAFIATVPLSNWLIANVGTTCVPDGPCLLPVWPGIAAPSGVLMAGVALVLRDLVHEQLGWIWVLAAIVIGAAIAAAITDPTIAAASLAAFLAAELVDMAIFVGLRRHGFVIAAICSSLVGIVLDSSIFVRIAFGNQDYVIGQIIGKVWAASIVLPVIAMLRHMSIQKTKRMPSCAGGSLTDLIS